MTKYTAFTDNIHSYVLHRFGELSAFPKKGGDFGALKNQRFNQNRDFFEQNNLRRGGIFQLGEH